VDELRSGSKVDKLRRNEFRMSHKIHTIQDPPLDQALMEVA